MDCSDNTCLVCHELIEIYAIGLCDHAICFKCSTRLRALCDQFYCPICRTDLPEVFFMGCRETFDKIPLKSYIQNRKLKIQFENHEIREKFELLLEHRCKICKNKPPEKSFRALKEHTSRVHTLFYCNLCLELKIFTSERKLYTRQELGAHRRVGDKDDTSYKGHPLCEFCDERYLDKDELYKHLRKDHYFCHFCESLGSQDFFDNYEVLRQHFEKEHYLCEEGECINAKFENAFRSKIDYQGHIVTHHSKAQNKQQSRQERTINIDINLVPRHTNRGRGVINGSDYEENRQGGSHRGGPHRGGSHRGGPPRHQHGGGRGGNYRRNMDREDRDVERAMQASLSTMKDTKPKQKDPEPVAEMKDLKPDLHDKQNFPSLGATADIPTTVPSSESDSKSIKASLANKVALANNMSVQHGVLGLEDFPDLKERNSTNSASKPNIPVSAKSKPASKYSSATRNAKTLEEEFPELPISKKPTADLSLKWKNQENVPKSVQKPKPVSKPMSKQDNAFDIRSMGKGLYSDTDFPSLGGSSGGTVNSNWFKPVDNSTNKKNQGQRESPTECSNLPVSERFSPVNVPNFDKNDPKTKKKNKKKKDKTEHVKEKENIKSNSSLDNIASMLMSSNSNSSENVNASSQKRSLEDVKPSGIEDKPKKSVSEKIPGKGKSEKQPKKVDKIEKMLEKELSTNRPVERTAPTPVRFAIDEDDFPGLGAPSKPIRKPPGFQKSPEVKPVKAPPGLNKPTVGAPPPGFSSGREQQVRPNKSHLPQDSVLISNNVSNFQYAQPSEFSERNKTLIGLIQIYCAHDENRFTDFKILSGEFRKGQIPSSLYYQRCAEVLGKENFAEVFPELLALLPSIEKQQQLLAVYMEKEGMRYNNDGVLKISGKSRMAKGAWTDSDSGFLTCQTCKQVLVRSDYNTHISLHSLDSDFPSLSSDKPIPGFRSGSWLKAN